MSKITVILLFSLICLPAAAQDTLRSFLVRKQPPYLHLATTKHKEASLSNKIVRGTAYSFTYNAVIGSALIFSPEQVTKWDKKDKFTTDAILNQYKRAFTTAPVIDEDLLIVDYLGHPYQGSIYYNSLRCQGANGLQSALFCTAHAVLWEYAWEGGIEQPSIQDLIVTPAAGILLGELSHVLTIKMSRNGFRWYEVVSVCLLNPMYAVNNGFKARRNQNWAD